MSNHHSSHGSHPGGFLLFFFFFFWLQTRATVLIRVAGMAFLTESGLLCTAAASVTAGQQKAYVMAKLGNITFLAWMLSSGVASEAGVQLNIL